MDTARACRGGRRCSRQLMPAYRIEPSPTSTRSKRASTIVDSGTRALKKAALTKHAQETHDHTRPLPRAHPTQGPAPCSHGALGSAALVHEKDSRHERRTRSMGRSTLSPATPASLIRRATPPLPAQRLQLLELLPLLARAGRAQDAARHDPHVLWHGRPEHHAILREGVVELEGGGVQEGAVRHDAVGAAPRQPAVRLDVPVLLVAHERAPHVLRTREPRCARGRGKRGAARGGEAAPSVSARLERIPTVTVPLAFGPHADGDRTRSLGARRGERVR